MPGEWLMCVWHAAGARDKSGRATPAAIRNITEEQVGMWYLCVLQMGKKCHVGFGRAWTVTGKKFC